MILQKVKILITVVEHLSMYDAAMGDISNVIAAKT